MTSIAHYKTDILVIGAGGAGLMASLSASHHEASVLCVSKVHPLRSHTVAAQGGINAALGNVSEDDWRWHMHDTIKAADGLGNEEAIEMMCRRAPEMIRQLHDWGVPFSRLPNGNIAQKVYGGQTTNYGEGDLAHRSCDVLDRTGHAIMRALYDKAVASQCQFLPDRMTLDLIMQDKSCVGALVWNVAEGVLELIQAKHTILATGGAGQLYATTTSAGICTGDGNALALRAGLPLKDMEFVQFHPTGLAANGMLLTEAARSAGAYLLNRDGERFMERYAPERMELSSRDVIARAMAQEMAGGRGCGEAHKRNYLHLSLKHIDPNVVAEKLPHATELVRCFAHKNLVEDLIPIHPSAHYNMGGIAVDVTGAAISGFEGVSAVGEAACMSVHGANRLGCNSLLDIVVFGQIIGEKVARSVRDQSFMCNEEQCKGLAAKPLERLAKKLDGKGDFDPHAVRQDIQQLMDNYVGVIRNADGLNYAKSQLLSMQDSVENYLFCNDDSLIYNNSLYSIIEVESLFQQAVVVVDSALCRTESRGAHFREDFPEKSE